MDQVARYFWWPTLLQDVFDFCLSCEDCARGKTTTQKLFRKLHPLPTADRPWQIQAMDFLTGLPAIAYRGRMVNAIMVVTDTFSKMVHLFAVNTEDRAEDIARYYHNEIYKHHGLPKAIISDRDPKFTSGYWRAFQRHLDTKLLMSSSRHFQTDGPSENASKPHP